MEEVYDGSLVDNTNWEAIVAQYRSIQRVQSFLTQASSELAAQQSKVSSQLSSLPRIIQHHRTSTSNKPSKPSKRSRTR